MIVTRWDASVVLAALVAACATSSVPPKPFGDVRLDRLEDLPLDGDAGVTIGGKPTNVRIALDGGLAAYELPVGYGMSAELTSSRDAGEVCTGAGATDVAPTSRATEFFFNGVAPGEYEVHFSVERHHDPVGPSLSLDGRAPCILVQRADKVHVFTAVLDKDAVSHAIKVLESMDLEVPPWNTPRR